MKEVAKDAYVDIGRPIAKPTGQLAGLVPRAIKAALAPVEKWVLQREYNVAETQKLLEIKLQNITPEVTFMSNFKFLLSEPGFQSFTDVAIAASSINLQAT